MLLRVLEADRVARVAPFPDQMSWWSRKPKAPRRPKAKPEMRHRSGRQGGSEPAAKGEVVKAEDLVVVYGARAGVRVSDQDLAAGVAVVSEWLGPVMGTLRPWSRSVEDLAARIAVAVAERGKLR